MNDPAKLKGAVDADHAANLATAAATAPTRSPLVIKMSMEGIPVVTKEMWAEIVERARQPSKKFRPYPIL